MKILLFVACLSVLHLGHSLKCYKCNGCETTSAVTETCQNVNPELQISACLTQKVDDRDNSQSITIKKCVTYGKNEPFKCLELPNSNTIFCHKCQGDFCNTQTRITTNFYLSLVSCSLIFLSTLLY
ncbi:hypothetical protein MTP99_017395 [Tenebrio molitor]|nr:hypothetical protein MTP99_017395 [Tenebrio molitor]